MIYLVLAGIALCILLSNFFSGSEMAYSSCNTVRLENEKEEGVKRAGLALYITEHFEGNSLIAAGDEDLIKIHFHTNEPWKVLEYCNTVGEIYDIVVEDMIRQANGLQG